MLGISQIGRRLVGVRCLYWRTGMHPGHKAMLALALHLHNLGCQVKIALPPVEWDNDVADWLAEGGKARVNEVMAEFLKDYEPPETALAVVEPEPPDIIDLLEASGLEEFTR